MADASAAPIAVLHRTAGAPDGMPLEVPFSQASTIVSMGRLESNQVSLQDRKISKVHCRCIVRTCKRKGAADGEVMTRIFIKDQSTFGTFVNGKALTKEQWTMLQEGDVIGLRNPHGNASLGEYSVKYHDPSGMTSEAPAPAAAPAAAQAAPGLMAVKQEAGSAPAAAPPPAALPAPLAVKQELAAPQRAAPLPVRPPLMSVKEELAHEAQKAHLPKPVDPRQPQVKVEPGQEPSGERPRAKLPQPVSRLPQPQAAAPAADDMALEGCSPLSEEDDGQPGDMIAEPLSPLSEVSEVSADDGSAPAPTGLPPGFPFMAGLMPGMPPPPGFPSMPGMPPGMMPPGLAAMLIRPGMPPLPPNMLAMLPGLTGMPGMPGMMNIPRPPPPAPVTTLALPGVKAEIGIKQELGIVTKDAPKPVVMNVQQELIGMLIGKGGETVKQLSKDSGARIEISKTPSADPGTEAERCVYLSGSEECIAKAKKMIEETLNKARERTGETNNPNACTLKVPHELIGMLIGRGGETIKEIKKESGARVDINKEAPMDGDEAFRSVHISGPPECVEFAKKMVEDMLGNARERVGTDGRPRSRSPRRGSRSPDRTLSLRNDTMTQTSIKVAHEMIGMLIGKGGDTIKAISKDSACRIEIAKDEAAEQEEKRTVYLSGPLSAIETAKRMIEDTLSNSREAREGGGGRAGGFRRSSRSRSRGRRSRSPRRGAAGPKVMRVPQELIGMIIGKGGETIKQISSDSRARVEISRDESDGVDRRVTLSGSPEEIDKAARMIEEVLDRNRGKGYGGKGYGGGRGRSPPRGALALRDEHDFNDGSDRRAASPIKDSWQNEKIYIDEVEMPRRPSFMPEHEDGLPSDLEIFVRGLPKACMEKDLWEHLYRLGATDVKEILLLRRQKQSKGMAYVVFNRHDHAMMAKHKLLNSPASVIPCGGQMPVEEKGMVHVRFSESERCINGRNNVYNTDMVGLLLGHMNKRMQDVKEMSGLRKVVLTGRNMKSYGTVDEDPRLHMVAYYEPEEIENVTKAIEVWGEQLGGVHLEIMDRVKGKGKGKFDPMMHFPPPMMGMPPMMGHPPPPGMMGMPPMPMRPPGPEGESPTEAPVLLQRRKLEPLVDGETPKMAGPKVLEATALRGRELRWQPWPEVGQFNEDWAALPMRWGLRGELFVLLRKRDTGDTRVCAAEVGLPLEKWPVLRNDQTGPKTAKYKSFIFNEHLFLISIDRESGSLKVYHVPDPSSAWDVAFETTLPEEADLSPEGFGASRRAKLSVFYAQDRTPRVVAVEPDGVEGAQLFKIVDPGKAWVRCLEAPPISNKARVLPVYTKNKTGAPIDYEVSIFAIDGGTNELNIFRVPADTDKPWIPVSTLPFAGDTRLCCVYVPGKPEPLLMAGSPTERLQKLCHLNLIEWTAHKLDDRMPPPKVPIVEEKFSRQMSSLWPESRDGGDKELVVATPIDCTADLPVSKHAWVTSPLLRGDELEVAGPGRGAPPGMPGMPGMPPPFGRSPFEDPMGGKGGHPPFDPRFPPPFMPGMPPPPFGFRPPFDDHFMKGGKGGPPPGFDPHRPPFDVPHPGGPPPGFERPPFGKGGPPFDMPPPGMPPHGGPPPPGRPPFDMPPGGRPPFDAPPGEWFGGGHPMPPRPAVPGAPDGGPPPGSLEVGSIVEADFREQGRFLRAKIIAKHEDGTFDVEYDGDYVEWKVAPSRVRPLHPFAGAPPPGASPFGAPPGAEAPKERRHRHRRHRGEGEEAKPEGEGGERRHHHRHRRHKTKEDGAEGSPAKEEDEPIPAMDDAPVGDAAPVAAEGEEGAGGHRKRRRHKNKDKKDDGEEQEKERSRSQEAEAGQKKERKRRHRSGEKGRRHKEAEGDGSGSGGDAPEP